MLDVFCHHFMDVVYYLFDAISIQCWMFLVINFWIKFVLNYNHPLLNVSYHHFMDETLFYYNHCESQFNKERRVKSIACTTLACMTNVHGWHSIFFMLCSVWVHNNKNMHIYNIKCCKVSIFMYECTLTLHYCYLFCLGHLRTSDA